MTSEEDFDLTDSKLPGREATELPSECWDLFCEVLCDKSQRHCSNSSFTFFRSSFLDASSSSPLHHPSHGDVVASFVARSVTPSHRC